MGEEIQVAAKPLEADDSYDYWVRGQAGEECTHFRKCVVTLMKMKSGVIRYIIEYEYHNATWGGDEIMMSVDVRGKNNFLIPKGHLGFTIPRKGCTHTADGYAYGTQEGEIRPDIADWYEEADHLHLSAPPVRGQIGPC